MSSLIMSEGLALGDDVSYEASAPQLKIVQIKQTITHNTKNDKTLLVTVEGHV